MNPKIPDILQRVIALAEKSLERPSGDARRQDEAERLFEDVAAAREWATDEPRRYVNDWTAMLIRMCRMIERLGPFGEAGELVRATTVGKAILPHVREDLGCAMDVARRAGREAVR